MNDKNVAIIIQARTTSSRFPKKMMAELGGLPLIDFIYRRCCGSPIKNTLVATSDHRSDDVLCDYCRHNGIPIMRGSLHNVLKRYIQAGELLGVQYIIRVCGDTPFVDVLLADSLLKTLIEEKLDYVSPDRSTCASGFYSEAVTLKSLKKAVGLTKERRDLEHVTRYIINQKERFSTRSIDAGLNPEFVRIARLTIDYPEDIKVANAIVNELSDKISFTPQDILNIIHKKGMPCLK